MAQRRKEFSSLAERRTYFKELKFGKLQKEEKPIIRNLEPQTLSKQDTLINLTESVESSYKANQSNELTSIPYFTNNVDPVNIFKESKSISNPNKNFAVDEILVAMIAAVLDLTPMELLLKDKLNAILLTVAYPITKNDVTEVSEMQFSSSYIQNANYTTVTIYDPCLYAIVTDHADRFIRSPITGDMFIMGSDISTEKAIIPRKDFDNYFITMAKTVFATTLIGRNIDMLGLMDFPSYQFSLGTYTIGDKINKVFIKTNASRSLIHVLPLWNILFSASFIVELTSNEVKFSYQHDTMFSHFEQDIETKSFHQVSDRTQELLAIPMRVSLSRKDDSISDYDVYTANIRVRNRLSSALDNVPNYTTVKDAMYPKNHDGAKTKLHSILGFMDLQNIVSVLDIGSAPGTWMELLMQMFPLVHGVTRNQAKDLKMYDSILQQISEHPTAQLFFHDAITHLHHNNLTYDLIVSDLATSYSNYVMQSSEHDDIYSKLLTSMLKSLNSNGSIVFKMYDLTPVMLKVIDSVSANFVNFAVIKPYGSCPTNPEVYIIAQGYDSDLRQKHHHIIPCFNHILYSQIANLNHLIVDGFNYPVKYNISYPINRLVFSDIERIPYHLHPCLRFMKFSEYLYPSHLTGTLIDEMTLLGDRYLRFQWDLPSVPFQNVRYVSETNIGYENKGIAMQKIFVSHKGFIIENGIRNEFFIVEEDAAFLFSDEYSQVCVSQYPSKRLPSNQFTIQQLLYHEDFKFMFPNITKFNDLLYHIRQLSLSILLEYQSMFNVNSSRIILDQFFREAETMHLSYTKNSLSSTISRYVKGKTVETLDLSKISERHTFCEEYKTNLADGKTPKQSFLLLLDKYTVQIGEKTLLSTSLCTTESQFIERATKQICISQPACIQFRRQIII